MTPLKIILQMSFVLTSVLPPSAFAPPPPRSGQDPSVSFPASVMDGQKFGRQISPGRLCPHAAMAAARNPV